MRLPLALRLRRDVLSRRDAVAITVVRALRPSSAELARAVYPFAFKSDEHAFARALVARRTQIWVFRSNQQAFCGDFVLVDVSAPDPSRRRAWVVDLKRGADLRVGGGGAGVQLQRAPQAIAEVARAGVLGHAPAWTAVTGDRRGLLGYFGVLVP